MRYMVEIVREIDELAFDEYPETVRTMLDQIGWEDPLNRLRVGVVLTFSLLEDRDEQYVKYNVDRLSDGATVFLIRPAWLNKGYDFKVCVEGWDQSANPAPRHTEIYSDLFWKREQDGEDAFEALCEAVFEVHQGKSADAVLASYEDRFDFSVGRTPEALLRPLPWLFIEQDIRFWNYTGRNMTIKLVEKLYDGIPLSELELELQELGEIHETPLAIQQN